jgi:hypothetical protein
MPKKICQCMALMFILIAPTIAQQQKLVLPTVGGASVPLYPQLARMAHVQGIVRIKVSTDGEKVTTIHVTDGNKLLATAAEENLRSWRFASHEPITFDVTYRYKLDGEYDGYNDNPVVLFRLPTEIEIATTLLPPLD